MNIKLASAVLFCSVAMSCSISEGQLLDRMLSRVGCSVCETASACDTGCDTGCGNEIISNDCGTSCGGGPGILDRIKGRLASVGCGGGCDAAPACGCVEPVVESCGCDAAPSCGGGLLDKLKGRLGSIGNGCGCAAAPDDCGCNVAPVNLIEPCGCDAAPSCGGGLLDRLKGRMSSIGGGGCGCAAPVANDCGCATPAPAPCVTPAPVADCGCDAAPVSDCGCSGGGLLDRLKGRLSSIGGGGCGCAAPVANDCGCATPAPAPCVTPAPVADCGCNAAPVSDCGCNGGRIRGAVGGVFGKLRNVGGCGCNSGLLQGSRSSCGCGDVAPAVTSCGTPLGRLSLLDRLRGNRIPRDRCGSVVGSGCNDGCNSPCPSTQSGCGCGAVAAPVASCGCGSTGGEMIYSAPAVMSNQVISEGAVMEATPTAADPATPADSGVIQEAPADTDVPAVDPNAFIIRGNNARG